MSHEAIFIVASDAIETCVETWPSRSQGGTAKERQGTFKVRYVYPLCTCMSKRTATDRKLNQRFGLGNHHQQGQRLCGPRPRVTGDGRRKLKTGEVVVIRKLHSNTCVLRYYVQAIGCIEALQESGNQRDLRYDIR